LRALQEIFQSLPIEVALEIIRHFGLDEQRALQDVIFGKMVGWRKAVRRGKVSAEQIETTRRLIREHVEAARQAQRPI
jgi:hypothetical protein